MTSIQVNEKMPLADNKSMWPLVGSTSDHKVSSMGMYMPTVIALIAYIILAIFIILPFDFPVKTENGKKYIVKYNFWQRFITILLLLVPVALSLYTINCLMSGNCVVWSYAVTAITAIWVLVFAIMAMVYTWSPQKQQGLPTTTTVPSQMY